MVDICIVIVSDLKKETFTKHPQGNYYKRLGETKYLNVNNII